jgi:FkbM family methyltransferase
MNAATPIKFAIQSALRTFGWEIRRYELADMAQLKRYLDVHGIQCVLDVGANIGQFATELRTTGYKGRIVSFEPQSDAYARLTSAAANDAGWTIAPRGAVGSASGEIEMNISDNSVSSSALPILDQHTDSAPSSRYVRTEKAPVIRLDDCDLFDRKAPTFLKIDTQGFEQHVLDGGAETLKGVRGVQMEMSLAPLYDGQAEFVALMSQMRAHGFDVWSTKPGFADAKTGRILQADATFFRANNCPP